MYVPPECLSKLGNFNYQIGKILQNTFHVFKKPKNTENRWSQKND